MTIRRTGPIDPCQLAFDIDGVVADTMAVREKKVVNPAALRRSRLATRRQMHETRGGNS